MIGSAIMLDVLGEQREQPDHWVLLAVVQRRIGITAADARAAVAAATARGWMETDTTFRARRQRVRLTAQGRALLTASAGSDRRLHPVERGSPRHIRRRLPTRNF